jgi:hypothetical protein
MLFAPTALAGVSEGRVQKYFQDRDVARRRCWPLHATLSQLERDLCRPEEETP